jgi:hypothetical protein
MVAIVIYVKFEIPTVVKNMILWDVMLCSWLDRVPTLWKNILPPTSG